MFALPLTVNKGFISGVLFQLPTGRTFQPILQPLAVVAMLNTDQFQKLSSPLVSWTHNIEKNGTGWKKKKLPKLTFKSVMAPNKHILDNLPSFHLLSWHTHHSKPPATSCVHLLCVLFYTYHGWPLIRENTALRVWPRNLQCRPWSRLFMPWVAELETAPLLFCFRVALQSVYCHGWSISPIYPNSICFSCGMMLPAHYLIQWIFMLHRCLCFVYAWGRGPYGFSSYWSLEWFMGRWPAQLFFWWYFIWLDLTAYFLVFFFFLGGGVHMFIVPTVRG